MRRIILSEQEIQFASEKFSTPLYLYNFHKIELQYAKLRDFLPENFSILYTLKANSNLSICHQLAELGSGADISSMGELKAAVKAGFLPQDMTFTGPGKTTQDLIAALEARIGIIVVESINEARRLNNLAQKYGIKQDILVRVNPLYRTNQSCEIREQGSSCGSGEIQDSQTVPPVQTIASSASKFGVDEAQVVEVMQEIQSLEYLNLKGIHVFTESNVVNYQQLLASWVNTMNIANSLNEQGYPISILDFGGGVGIPYNWVDAEFDVESFGQELQQIFANNPYKYHCIVEIGRYLVGEAGCYITEVLDIKESLGKKFIIVDGGVHQLLRLSMKPASKYMEVIGKNGHSTQTVTMAGKLPTPLDIMVEDVEVPENLEIGDRTPEDEVNYPDTDLIAKYTARGWIFTRQDGTSY